MRNNLVAASRQSAAIGVRAEILMLEEHTMGVLRREELRYLLAKSATRH